MTATLEAAPATATKKNARGTTSPAPKAQLPKKVKAAAEAFAKDVAKKTPAKQAVKKLEKAVAPKAKPALKPRKVSAMQVIRRTLAHDHNATVEMISKVSIGAEL